MPSAPPRAVRGCDEREVLVAETGFKWDALLAANAEPGPLRHAKSSSICASRQASRASRARRRSNSARRIPIRIRRCSSRCRGSTARRRRRPGSRRSAEAGVAIAVYPLERDELPAWIAARLARQKQRVGRETLAFLAERCEGNLLAARQEIEKLGLLLPEGELDAEAVERAVTDVARYDVFQLSEAWLAGDAARALRIIAALEAEGEGIQLLLWQLGEDVHALAFVLDAAASGTPFAVAIRNARVWGKRQAAMERAARRLESDAIASLLGALARLDALSKGIGRGNVWDELRATALTLAGARALPLPAMPLPTMR